MMTTMSSYPAFEIAWRLAGIGAVIAGWGAILAILVRRKFDVRLRLGEMALLGAALLYVVGGVWSLFGPLDGGADVALAAIGIAGLATALFDRAIELPNRRVAALVTPVWLLVSAGTALTPLNFDAGLYHMQLLKYMERSSIPFGIANIHSRFGFNSSTTIHSAQFSGPIFGIDGAFIFPAAIFLLFCLYCLDLWLGSPDSDSLPCARLAAASMLLAWIVNLGGVLFEWFSLGPNGDVPAAIFCCWSFLLFIVAVESPPDTTASLWQFVGLSLCCGLAVSAKLSQLPVALLVPAAIWLRSTTDSSVNIPRVAYLPVSLFTAVWLAQGLVTSGCLLFPLVSSCVPFFSWTAVPAETSAIADAVRSWARNPGANPASVLSGWDWISGWKQNMLTNRPIYSALIVTATAGLAGAAALRVAMAISPEAGNYSGGASAVARRGVQLGVLTSILGLLAWFWLAPDPRFAIGFGLSFAALAWTAIFVLSDRGQFPVQQLRWLTRASIAILAVSLLSEFSTLATERRGASALAWRTPPIAKSRDYTTQSGLQIKVASENQQCWDEAAVCSIAERPHLARIQIFGHTGFTGRPELLPTPVAPTVPEPPASLAQPASGVVFGPDVWGAEQIKTQSGSFQVRWLQQATTMSIHSDAPRSIDLKIRLASHGGPRSATLAHQGKMVRNADLISGTFFSSDPDALVYSLRLEKGTNVLTLRSDRPCTDISPNRPGCFLLIEPVKVDPKD